MNKYKTSKDLIDNELSRYTRNQLYPIIQMGELVYRDILNSKDEIFTSNIFSSLLPRIRTRAIHCQFEEEMLAKDFPFKCKMQKVNNFNDYVPILTIGNLVIHIAHAPDENSLPSFSRYKEKYSYFNKFNEKQSIFDYIEQPFEVEGTREEPYYAIITFGGKKELEFINLIVPSPGFKEILYKTDLKTELKLVKIDKENNKVKKRRLEIREHVLEEISRKDKEGGSGDM